MAGLLPIPCPSSQQCPCLSVCPSDHPSPCLSVFLIAETKAWKPLIPKPALLRSPELVLSTSQPYFSLRLILTVFSHHLLWLPSGRLPRYFQSSCGARYNVPCHTVRFWEALLSSREMAEDWKRKNIEGLRNFFSSDAVWGNKSRWMRWEGKQEICVRFCLGSIRKKNTKSRNKFNITSRCENVNSFKPSEDVDFVINLFYF